LAGVTKKELSAGNARCVGTKASGPRRDLMETQRRLEVGGRYRGKEAKSGTRRKGA
jgi:hypothetical protein